jgi:hypothetical protein
MSRGQLLPVLVLVRVSLGSDVAMQGSRLRHQLESGASTSVLTIIGQLRAGGLRIVKLETTLMLERRSGSDEAR